MIEYNDIIKAATMVLAKKFPNIPVYASETIEGYKPSCFFVELLPIETVYETLNIAQTTLTLVISYFSETNNGIENRNMIMQIKRAFGLKLQVGKRHLTLEKSTSEVVGDVDLDKRVFHTGFDITYKEFTDQLEEKCEVARELQQRITVENSEKRSVKE